MRSPANLTAYPTRPRKTHVPPPQVTPGQSAAILDRPADVIPFARRRSRFTRRMLAHGFRPWWAA
jgi:hypothetical protein